MSDVLHIPPTGGSRSDVRRLVEALLAGELVGLPSETGYLVCGSPLAAQTVSRLSALAPDRRAALYVSEPEAAEDYVAPDVWNPAAQRLARRCWPGPVVLEFSAPASGTLWNELPAAAAGGQPAPQQLRIACSGQPLLREIGRELPWPLLAAASSRERPDERFASAAELQQRCGAGLALLADGGPPRYQDRATVVRIEAAGWDVAEEGIVGRRTVSQLASEIILFVCTGNTCRSPMAEALFRKLLAESLDCGEDALTDRGFVVLSAGLATTSGMPASEHSVSVLAEEGIDLSGHHSQPASPELLSVADHILTMTRSHRESILSRFPEMESRVRLLSEEGRDVSDPFGGDRDEYVRCRDEIRDHVLRLCAKLSS